VGNLSCLNKELAYADQDDYDQAITDWDRSIHLKPDYARAYINRGTVYQKQGQRDKAIADFRKALEFSTDPNWRDYAEQQLQAPGAK